MRITTAQITRWQHRLGADFVQHGQRCQSDFTEQALGTTTGEIEYRVRCFIDLFRIAQDRYNFTIFGTQHGAHGLRRQTTRHRLLHKVHNLLGHLYRTTGRCRQAFLSAVQQPLQQVMRQALALVAPFDHRLAHQPDDQRVSDIEKGHRQPAGGAETLFTLRTQNAAHTHRDIAEIDIDGARAETLVTNRAVIGDIVHFIEMANRNPAPGLFLVEKRLYHHTRCQYLVTG